MPKTKTSWKRISVSSTIVSAIALGTAFLWDASAIELLLALFFFGAAAGWASRRQGWLSGIIVGIPLAFLQLTRLALQEYGTLSFLFAQPEYWRLVVPATVAAAGMAIMGGIAGAWLQDMHLQRGS